MNAKPMRKGNSDPLTQDQAEQLAALETMPDETIDTSDIPEVRDWSKAVRGKHYPGFASLPGVPVRK